MVYVGLIVTIVVIVLISFIVIGFQLDDNKLRRNYEQFDWYTNVSGGPEDMSVDYFESKGGLGLWGPRPGRTVYVPTEDRWNEVAPDFAKGRRQEILERIKRSLPHFTYLEKADAGIMLGGPRRSWDQAKNADSAVQPWE